MEHGLEGLLGGEDVGDEGEREGHGGAGGGGGGGSGVREPEEAVGGEDKEAGLEGREVGDLFALEVNRGDYGALDLVLEEDRPPAARLGHRRQPLSGH